MSINEAAHYWSVERLGINTPMLRIIVCLRVYLLYSTYSLDGGGSLGRFVMRRAFGSADKGE